jgi:molecular chaperone GrpE
MNEERIRERKYFNQSLMERLVSALDIFDRTINIETDDEKLKNFLIGFKMINDNLKQILEDEGVKLIESIGKQFDPSVHHAIETTYDENYEEGVILEEIQRGYTFKDRVLRAALVKVNKKVKEENNNNE